VTITPWQLDRAAVALQRALLAGTDRLPTMDEARGLARAALIAAAEAEPLGVEALRAALSGDAVRARELVAVLRREDREALRAALRALSELVGEDAR
jgi:hypothetical protein